MNPRYLSSLFLLIASCFSFCGEKKTEPPLFELADRTGIDFNNKVVDGEMENGFIFRNYYNGGGVAIGDINNDGLSDVMLTSNMADNKLFLNKGKWQFADVTQTAGLRQDSMWSTGVVFADVNNDAWLDIYVCNSGHMKDGNRTNKLYINNHDLTFTESAEKYGLAISAYTTHVSFFDYDLDGDLDCFMINNSPMPINTLGYANRRNMPDSAWPVANFLKGGGDHLFRNDGGRYTEVSNEAGIHGTLMSFGLGVSISDINGDGYPDVFVSNDSFERDYLYINQRNGTFRDECESWMQHTSLSSMGADIADINNDGRPDLFTTDMLPEDDYRLKTLGFFDNIDVYNAKIKAGFYHQFMKNCLQLNYGGNSFLETGNYSGVSATDWSWGALMFDMDNDGWNDIYVCNGVNRDVTNLDFTNFFANDAVQKIALNGKMEQIDEVLGKIPVNPMLNKVYRNQGNLRFADVGESWGFVHPSFSNGAAYGDLDNDGDLDMVINNENGPAFVYRNNAREQNGNNYIGLFLSAAGGNAFAIGSKIGIYSGSKFFLREQVPSRGFQSSVDYKQIIGLGSLDKIDSVKITWPDRTVTMLRKPAINKVHHVAQQAGGTMTGGSDSILSTVLLPRRGNFFDRHTEDDYTDYYYERNLPELLSREGPKAAVGDVDGDGLDDIYIGGAAGQEGQLYLQGTGGTLRKKEQAAFRQFADFEDVAVLLFDCDNDRDLDLLVCPGGNNVPAYSRQMELRLLVNDGKANFTLDPAAFPAYGMNAAVAITDDINGDGYADLFVGSRSIPRQYGSLPVSFVYLNDGRGHFRDIAKTKNRDIANIGMVTGAVFADIAGDRKKELVIAGEWMPPRIFSFDKDHFQEISTNLTGLHGCWKTVAAADMDGDGREDLLLGNIGENFYLQPAPASPVRLWVSDFDRNSSIDKIITRTVDGKDVPVFLKNDMEEQLPSLRKQNLKHAEFAKKTIGDLFTPEMLKGALRREFNFAASCIAFNEGDGTFRIEQLPALVQLSSVNAILCTDINNDGLTDVIAGGNNFGFPPQFGRLDASMGHVLINRGKRQFSLIDPGESGLKIPGEIRDIGLIKAAANNHLLFLLNNDFPALFELRRNGSKFSSREHTAYAERPKRS